MDTEECEELATWAFLENKTSFKTYTALDRTF